MGPAIEGVFHRWESRVLLEVRVHQLVKNLQGDVLSDSEVRHVFSIKDGLIKSMDLKGEEAGSSSGPSAAFAKH